MRIAGLLKLFAALVVLTVIVGIHAGDYCNSASATEAGLAQFPERRAEADSRLEWATTANHPQALADAREYRQRVDRDQLRFEQALTDRRKSALVWTLLTIACGLAAAGVLVLQYALLKRKRLTRTS